MISNTLQNPPKAWKDYLGGMNLKTGVSPVTQPPISAGTQVPALVPKQPSTSITGMVNTNSATYTPPTTPSVAGYQQPQVIQTQPAQASGGLAQTPTQSTNRGLFSDVVSSLAKPQTPQETKDAMKFYQESIDRLGGFERDVAGKRRGIYEAPSSARIMSARDMALQAITAEERARLQSALQEAQAGIGYGQTQQQLNQQALSSAATYAQPQLAAYGQGFYNPLNPQEGASGSSSSLNPLNNINSIAQQVISGQLSPSQAEAMGGNVQNFAGALNQAIINQNPQYNRAQAQAQFDAMQANTQTAGTAGVDIARQGLQQATMDYMNMMGAAQYAGSQSQRVSAILDRAGLNNVSSTDYNKVLNSMKGRFSDQDFTALDTALREAQQAYATLLSTGGGTPSGQEAQALAVLDISKSSSAINAAIRELEAAVANRLQAQNSIRSQYEQNVGGGQSNYGGGSVFAEEW